MAQADYPLLNDPEMKEIFESFIIETKEILEQLDIDLVQIENAPEDNELLNKIFRSFHTIKGTSGFLGLNKLQALTHKCEDILNKLRKGEAKLNNIIMDGILASFDTTQQLIDVIEDQKDEAVDISSMLESLGNIIDDMNKKLSQKNETPDVEKTPEIKSELADNKLDDEKLVQKPKKKKVTKSKTASKAKSSSKAKTETAAKSSTKSKATKASKPELDAKRVIEEVVAEENLEQFKTPEEGIETIDLKDLKIDSNPVENVKVEDKIENEQTSKNEIAQKNNYDKYHHSSKAESSIRVDVQRLDDLLNFVQELVLGRNRLAQINQEVSSMYEGSEVSRDLAEATRQIDLMTTELQLAVMKTRMVRIGKVFNRFPRLVRDLSRNSGKQIDLVIKGEETELDKTLIEEINDPLVHLVRNSADHGIESPEIRKAKGKPEKGTLTLSAEHEGNFILITVEDDGKGIDPEVIKKKAIERELISKEKAAELSVQEINNFIFSPGFSTAAKVTNVSGRGVGMDVVKTNVTKLRGIISIESKVGEGTKILIKLPLTLAIIQGLLVKVSDETIVIPLNSVIEVVRVSKEQIYSINQTQCIKLRDTVHPLINIDDSLYLRKSDREEQEWQYVVIVSIAEKAFGIKVDDLIGQKEVVIKSLGNYLGNVEGVAGSTIMGDGKVIMIADIAELVHNQVESN